MLAAAALASLGEGSSVSATGNGDGIEFDAFGFTMEQPSKVDVTRQEPPQHISNGKLSGGNGASDDPSGWDAYADGSLDGSAYQSGSTSRCPTSGSASETFGSFGAAFPGAIGRIGSAESGGIALRLFAK